jgi:hypothetical protein
MNISNYRPDTSPRTGRADEGEQQQVVDGPADRTGR